MENSGHQKYASSRMTGKQKGVEFFTIGVFNSTGEAFFHKIATAGIDTFCDIRHRRGVRGRTYAFVNSKRLQEKLRALNIRYLHIDGLAPDAEIIHLQMQADASRGESNKVRSSLSDAFVERYQKEVLSRFDLYAFVQQLEASNARKVVLFCLEELPGACHRSLVAARLQELGYMVSHL